MVIWDNRSVMHQANGDYDMAERATLSHHDRGRSPCWLRRRPALRLIPFGRRFNATGRLQRDGARWR